MSMRARHTRLVALVLLLGVGAYALRCPDQTATTDYALNEVAVKFLNHGRMTEAQLCMEDAVALAPHVPLYHFNLGGVFFKLSKFDDALISFQNALRLDPEDERAQELIERTHTLMLAAQREERNKAREEQQRAEEEERKRLDALRRREEEAAAQAAAAEAERVRAEEARAERERNEQNRKRVLERLESEGYGSGIDAPTALDRAANVEVQLARRAAAVGAGAGAGAAAEGDDGARTGTREEGMTAQACNAQVKMLQRKLSAAEEKLALWNENPHGNNLPWMGWMEAQIMKMFLVPGETVLVEWGAGSVRPTFYFASFVKKYIVIESSVRWCEHLQREAKKKKLRNVEVYCVPPEYPRPYGHVPGEPSSTEQFATYIDFVHKLNLTRIDVALIDGRARPQVATSLIPLLSYNSVVFMHDFWERRDYHVVLDYFYEVISNKASLKVGQSVTTIAGLRKKRGDLALRNLPSWW